MHLVEDWGVEKLLHNNTRGVVCALLQEHTHEITCKESLILWVTLHLPHHTCISLY